MGAGCKGPHVQVQEDTCPTAQLQDSGPAGMRDLRSPQALLNYKHSGRAPRYPWTPLVAAAESIPLSLDPCRRGSLRMAVCFRQGHVSATVYLQPLHRG